MEDVLLFITVFMAGVAAIISIVSLISWYRMRTIKYIILTSAFLVFCINFILQSLEVITQDTIALILDMGILILLYLSVIIK